MNYYIVTYEVRQDGKLVEAKTIGVESKKEIIDELNEPILLSFVEHYNESAMVITDVHEIDETEFSDIKKHLFFL